MAPSYINSELFSLADETIAALASPKSGLVCLPDMFRGKSSNSSKAVSRVYRKMRQATRYVLEDELTEYIARFSAKIESDQLYEIMTSLARLPNDFVWVEWDEKVRVRELNAARDNPLESSDLDHIADRVGYLAENTSDEQSIFTMVFRDNKFDDNVTIAHQPLSIGRQKVYLSPVSFEINFSGEFAREEVEAHMKDFDNNSIPNQEDTNEYILVNREMSRQFLARWWSVENAGHHADKICDSIRGVQTEAIHWWCKTDDVFDLSALAQANDMAAESAEGDARFLICLLGFINFDWYLNEPKRKFAHSRIRYGKVSRGNDYRVLTLKLPKKSGIVVDMPEPSDSSSMKRLHEVRGHFCVRKKSGKRFWRKAHKRGDKSLGTITKDYKLEH